MFHLFYFTITMGIFSRVVDILKTELNDATDKMKYKYDADGFISFDDVDKEYEKMFGTGAQEEETTYENYRSQEANAPDPSEKEYYEALEVPYGASYEQIKTAYKKLIKEYHPDKYHNEPKKHQMALEVTQRLNKAYNYFQKKYNK